MLLTIEFRLAYKHSMVFIVAIDGPVGSGKSSVAKKVAANLQFAYVDTGAIYRALALTALNKKVPWDNPDQLVKLAQNLDICFLPSKSGQKTLLGGIDVSLAIRTEEISQGSSKVSQYQKVRDSLLDLQRQLGEKSDPGAVLEGRDIGTVVFPNAKAKFFLNASDEERARRRFLELQSLGEKADFNEVFLALKERDKRDKSRQAAPLMAASDAILIDTDMLSQNEVVDLITIQVKQVL